MKASYKYQAEDVDELNFEVGEIVHVVQYEDPEEQVRAERKCGYGRRGVHETLPAPFRSKVKTTALLKTEFPTTLQEEGWLMGIKEANGQKGMFPANFTRPM